MSLSKNVLKLFDVSISTKIKKAIVMIGLIWIGLAYLLSRQFRFQKSFH